MFESKARAYKCATL
jgi:hypothetical protein